MRPTRVLAFAFVALLAIVFLFPLYVALLMSLKTAQQTFQSFYALPPGLNLSNFVSAWQTSHYPTAIVNSLIVTAISVIAAVAVGAVELAQITTEKLHLSGGIWDVIAGIDFGNLGIFLVVAFLAIWGVAVLIWKVYRIEERYAVKGKSL